jgi:hypothetical protein
LHFSPALNLNEKSQALRLNFWQWGSRRTLERELPIFLNLLKVTTKTGLNLPQSLKCLNQSLDTSCPRLVKTFTDILKHANSNNVSLDDALLEASHTIKVDFIANLMTSLAVPNPTTDELLSIVNTQTEIANSLPTNKCLRLRKNYWRRWTPHVLFFIMFALPLTLTPMLGPALATAPVWAIGPNAYGIPFHHALSDF